MIMYRYNIRKDAVLMSSSRVRDSSPAIPEPFSPALSRFFVLQERVSVFDHIDHQRMREKPTRKVFNLDGQVSLFD